jgi:hypothetical protein
MRGDDRAVAVLSALLSTVQISPSASAPGECVAHGWWDGPLDSLDRRLREAGVAGFALVGVLEEDIVVSHSDATGVQAWRVAVQFDVKNSPLFVYLTGVLAAVKVEPEPYSDRLWLEGTFMGALADLKDALQQLHAEELRVLNSRDVTTVVEPPPGVPSRPVIERDEPALALSLSVGPEALALPDEPIVRRRTRYRHWWPALAAILILVVGLVTVGLYQRSRSAMVSDAPPRETQVPVDPHTTPWAYMVERHLASSWARVQQENGWSHDEMQRLLGRLGDDLARTPALAARSFRLLRSQSVRTPDELSMFSQSLRVRYQKDWPFPDHPPDGRIDADQLYVVRFLQELSKPKERAAEILDILWSR